jgi:hypothetical protein
MIDWAIRLAWLAVIVLPLLPLLGRWFDPPPPITPQTHTGLLGGLSAMVDVFAIITQRLWMFPVIIGLCVTVLLLTVGAFAALSYQDASWAQRRLSLWPLMALPVMVFVTTLLDDHLPEFGR